MLPKIIGCGLPRSGTTSLAKAFEILGYETLHHCPYTNPTLEDVLRDVRGWMQQSGNRAVVTSAVLPYLDQLTEFPALYLDRPKKEVEFSLQNLGHDPADIERSFGGIEIPAWVDQVATSDVAWEPVCQFAGCEVPSVPYPRENQGPINFAI